MLRRFLCLIGLHTRHYVGTHRTYCPHCKTYFYNPPRWRPW